MTNSEGDVCEQCTCLLEQGADCLPTLFSDIPQSLQLNGIPTPAKSCANGHQKGGSLICKCGKETLGCSIHPTTRESWIASMQDSLARILASPEIRQGLALKQGVASTVKSSASLGYFDHASCSWKMSQQSFLTDSEQSLQIWPRSGMTLNGYVYELPTVGRITTGIDGGVWLGTPTASMTERSAEFAEGQTPSPAEFVRMWPTPTRRSPQDCASERKRNTPSLEAQVNMAMWPTPCASDNRDRGNLSTPAVARRVEKGKQVMLSMSVSEDSGRLNPTWVCWLMGFPLTWFDGVEKK